MCDAELRPGWVEVVPEVSVDVVELSCDACVRIRGSFSVFTDWIS